MKPSKEQLQLIDKQVKRLVAGDSYYGKMYREMGLTEINSEEDFYKILTQPDNAVTKQYAALLRPDNVNLSFTEDALREIAKFAFRANEQNENIGARRLHTVMENLLNDISFNANGQHPLIDVVIDGDYVDSHLASEWTEDNIHKYIL